MVRWIESKSYNISDARIRYLGIIGVIASLPNVHYVNLRLHCRFGCHKDCDKEKKEYV
jgi:hypothetical protein